MKFLASGGQSSPKLIPALSASSHVPEEGILTGTCFARDQVPDCPILTRAKNKLPSLDEYFMPRHSCFNRNFIFMYRFFFFYLFIHYFLLVKKWGWRREKEGIHTGVTTSLQPKSKSKVASLFLKETFRSHQKSLALIGCCKIIYRAFSVVRSFFFFSLCGRAG